jgi:diguanylate cyclase (GGDEF)-like protein/PAS domain S-box-containing protein
MSGSSVILQFPSSSIGPGSEDWRESVDNSASVPHEPPPPKGPDALERARDAADLLGFGFWHFRPLVGKIHLSPLLKQTLGYLESELKETFEAFVELIHTDDRSKATAAFMESQGHFSIEVRIIRRDGIPARFLVKGWADPSSPENQIGTLVRLENQTGPASEPEARKLLSEAIEAGVEAMLVLRAARNEEGDPADFEIVALNKRGAKLLGIQREAAIGRLLGEVAPNAREEGFVRRYAEVMTKGEVLEQEFHAAPGGFQQIWMRQRVVPLADGVAVFAEDVSETKRSAETADRSKRMYERITASTPDLHAVWDLETRRFVYSNRNFFEILGYETDPSSVVNIPLMERLIAPDDLPRFQAHLRLLAEKEDDEVAEASFRFRASDGSYRWLLFRDAVFERNGEGRAKTVLATAQDISRQKAYEAELEATMVQLQSAREELEDRQRDLENTNQRLGNLAVTDGLTGLKNHRAFQERLTEEVERAQRYNLRLALLMADVDHFKEYNDQYGHPAGDKALKGFADVLTEVSRSSDLVVRYGGEEFALILPNTGSEEAACLAERVRVSLRASEFGSQGVTASFGCAELTPGREARERLMRDADSALYESKNAGRDKVTIAKSE